MTETLGIIQLKDKDYTCERLNGIEYRLNSLSDLHSYEQDHFSAFVNLRLHQQILVRTDEELRS